MKNQDGCHSLSFSRTRKRTMPIRLADPENLYIPGFEGNLKKVKIKFQSSGGGHFDYWLKAENLSRYLHTHGQHHIKNWRDPIIIFQVIAVTRDFVIKK